LSAPFSWRHYFTWLILVFGTGFYVFVYYNIKLAKSAFWVLFVCFIFAALNPFYIVFDFLKDIFGRGVFFSGPIKEKPVALFMDYNYLYVSLFLWLYFLNLVKKNTSTKGGKDG